MRLVLLLVLVCCVCGARESNQKTRCKKHEHGPIYTPQTQSFCHVAGADGCRVCASVGCGYCGGVGCGVTPFGCYNISEREEHKLCQFDGDIWYTNPEGCDDLCSEFQTCDKCVMAQLPKSYIDRGWGCGWKEGVCVLGTEGGPLPPVAPSSPWRFASLSERDDPLILKKKCGMRLPCVERRRCFECIESFSSDDHQCFFCADSRIPVNQNSEGGGRCLEPGLLCDAGRTKVLYPNDNMCPQYKDASASAGTASTSGTPVRKASWLFIVLFVVWLAFLMSLVVKLSA